jgi:hypothetical protein
MGTMNRDSIHDQRASVTENLTYLVYTSNILIVNLERGGARGSVVV